MSEEKKVDPLFAVYGEYWLALGKFVSAFADVEVMTTVVLGHFAGTSPQVSQAIFSGTRGKGAIEFINRICEAKHVPRDADLESAFTQFNVLTEVRNTILHHGARIEGDDLVATNDAMANLIPRTIKKVTVSAAILDAMTQDAETIRIKLMLFTMRGKEILLPGPVLILSALGARPWRYKSPSQASPARTNPGKSAKRPRQRKASREKS
jgi:hypothetical protein